MTYNQLMGSSALVHSLVADSGSALRRVRDPADDECVFRNLVIPCRSERVEDRALLTVSAVAFAVLPG
jgi:hypothetical protein